MEIRCEKCGKLLTIIKECDIMHIEIKCGRCKHINEIEKKSIKNTK